MKRRNVLVIIGVLIVILIGFSVVLFVKNANSGEEEKPKEIVHLDEIEGYGYILEDRDTELFKIRFESLSDELKKEEVDFEEYAGLLAEMYIIDLYTISNKMNQYDVGGSEYVHPDAKENYELKVKDTLYKYVEDNSYGKREQELPTVSTIEIVEISEEKQFIGEEEVDGYTVSVLWTYEKDIGYDTEATVNLAKVDEKLYVISQSVSEE